MVSCSPPTASCGRLNDTSDHIPEPLPHAILRWGITTEHTSGRCVTRTRPSDPGYRRRWRRSSSKQGAGSLIKEIARRRGSTKRKATRPIRCVRLRLLVIAKGRIVYSSIRRRRSGRGQRTNHRRAKRVEGSQSPKSPPVTPVTPAVQTGSAPGSTVALTQLCGSLPILIKCHYRYT